MRPRAFVACALSIIVGTAGCPARASIEITFGITSNTAFGLAHYIATEKKYYEAEGLKVDSIVAGAAVGVVRLSGQESE
jgi:ABC-type nitrate/sulfonate/bicarbonate transport system substrate-binding protein